MKRWTIIVILAGLCLLTSMLLFNTNAELRTVKAQFYSAEIELGSTKVELGATESELQLTKLFSATFKILPHFGFGKVNQNEYPDDSTYWDTKQTKCRINNANNASPAFPHD